MKCFPTRQGLLRKSQKHTFVTAKIHILWAVHNMGGSAEKEENVLNICFRKGRTAGNYPIYEPNHISWVLYLLVQSLINSACPSFMAST